MGLTRDIEQRLSHFFGSYLDKVGLLRDLERKRRAPDEIVLLACCYFDHLGGCLFPLTGSTRRSFELVLLQHSGEAEEFSRVSVADLATALIGMSIAARWMVTKPGRVTLHSDEAKPLLRFADRSRIALTRPSFERFFARLFAALKSEFRVESQQTLRKKSHGTEPRVLELITGRAPVSEEAAKELIREYRYSSILYREYRCKAVHEVRRTPLHRTRFWRARRPYFTEIHGRVYRRPYLSLEFPSRFLIGCLQTCIQSAQGAVLGRGMLPAPIWNAICYLDELEALDPQSLVEDKEVRLKID